EAGGHRGMFLTENTAAQVGTFALVPQIADAVRIPVVATGGIADARAITAALALGAAGVQIGTAFLFTPEAKISQAYRTAVAHLREDETVLSNVMTGRPARGIANQMTRELGPIADDAPAYPLAARASAPLQARAEAQGTADFSPQWAGQ